jgi:mRNA-degrading endonuclease toxin of MazEF toxin-antitoxin module
LCNRFYIFFLEKTGAVDAFQIRSVSEIRFGKKTGVLTNEKMVEIVQAIVTVVSDI